MKISELEELLNLIKKSNGDLDLVFSRADIEFGCYTNCDFEIEIDEEKDKLILTVI